MVCYSYLNQTKPKANLAAHALYQFSIRENHLISERERQRDRQTETETDRERHRERQTERQRETETERDRDRDRDRDRECLCLWQPKSIMAFIKPFEVPQEM